MNIFYTSDIDQLDDLQLNENRGNGIQCVKNIIFELRCENYIVAKRIALNTLDKIALYPIVANFMKDIGLISNRAYVS